MNAPKKWWDRLKTSLIKHGFTSCALDPFAFVLQKSGKIHGVLGMHVDDVIGGGNETFDRIMTTVRKEFDFGAWDVGNFRFKGRQISQMPSGETVCDMEQNKHELEQIDLSKADKTKPERVLNSKGTYPIPRRRWESGLVRGSLQSTVTISAGRTATKTGVTDSSRFAETQQSDLRSEHDWVRSRSGVLQWNIFASSVFMMRLMQISKEVRHSRVISFLQYMQALRIVVFLCLC